MPQRNRKSGLSNTISYLIALTALCISCGQEQPAKVSTIAKTNAPTTRAAESRMEPVRTPVQTPNSPSIRTNAIQIAKVTPHSVTNAASGISQRVFETQVALVRHGISAGSIDGLLGYQTRAAVRAFQQKQNLTATAALDSETLQALGSTGPPMITYSISTTDLQRLQPLGKTWLAKSQQTQLDYETILELVAEKSQAHPNLIRRLNPGIDWEGVSAGTSVYVPAAAFPVSVAKAAFVRIYLGQRMLEAFDESTNLLAHFPCSIAQRVEKRPVGELHVSVMAPNPNYTFDPDVFPESAEARELNRKLLLQPGPNNPVGTVWIGLDKPGYGIHGTPRPEDVGRTESHGCFRLANWNAEFLVRLLSVGTPVIVQ